MMLGERVMKLAWGDVERLSRKKGVVRDLD
jgi:hypothetical protein